MALSNGCTGQQIIDEINSKQNATEVERKITERVNQDDLYIQAGDIKYSCRTDFGDNWLLCDGRFVTQTDYPDLYDVLGDSCLQNMPIDLFGAEAKCVAYNHDDNIFMVGIGNYYDILVIVKVDLNNHDNMWTIVAQDVSIDRFHYAGNGKYNVDGTKTTEDFITFTEAVPSNWNTGYTIDYTVNSLDGKLYRLYCDNSPSSSSTSKLTLYLQCWDRDLQNYSVIELNTLQISGTTTTNLTNNAEGLVWCDNKLFIILNLKSSLSSNGAGNNHLYIYDPGNPTNITKYYMGKAANTSNSGIPISYFVTYYNNTYVGVVGTQKFTIDENYNMQYEELNYQPTTGCTYKNILCLWGTPHTVIQRNGTDNATPGQIDQLLKTYGNNIVCVGGNALLSADTNYISLLNFDEKTLPKLDITDRNYAYIRAVNNSK